MIRHNQLCHRYTYPVSCNSEFHIWVYSTRFHTNAFRVRVRPEIVFGSIQGVRFESDALAVTHSDRLQQQASAFEQMVTAVGWSHAVVKSGNDTGIDVCS